MIAFTVLSEATEDYSKRLLICNWKPEVGNESPAAVKQGIYKWNENLEHLVNLQIRLELIAFYSYLSMSRFFQRYDQDRQGFAKYFRKSAFEELEHSEMFMKYQQTRGGNVDLKPLPAPPQNLATWLNAKDVLESAFLLEKDVTDEIICLHAKASELKDIDFLNFLEEKIIPEQYESMKEIKTHIKNLARACPVSDEKCSEYPVYELQYEQKLKEEK